MSLPCLWGDPALCHPSQPNTVNMSMQRLKSPQLNRPLLEILDHGRLSKEWHLAWKKNLRGTAVIFCACPHLALQFLRKQRRKSHFLLAQFPYTYTDMGIRVCHLYGPIHLHIHLPFWWLSVRTSKVVLIVLMIMCHSDMSHVGCRAGLPATRQGEATGWCCVVL